MRTAIFTFLLTALLPFCSRAQTPPADPRWTLTPVDSMVHGPYSDFRLMAANRYVSDQVRRQALWDVRSYQLIIDRKDRENEALRGAFAASEEKNTQLTAQSWERFDLLTQEREKNAKLSGWATVGKVWTIALGGSVLGLTTIAVIHAVRP